MHTPQTRGADETALASHARVVLEVDRVLDRIAAHAGSDLGAEHVRRLKPLPTPERARATLQSVAEMRGVLQRDPGWSLGPIPDVHEALAKLGIEGSVLEIESLVACSVLLRTSRLARRDLEATSVDLPRLQGPLERLVSKRRLEKRLGATFDEAANVVDTASRELGRIRRSLRGRRSELVEQLEAYARALPDRVRVSDGSVTVRAGRYCLPIRREGRGAVGGIVHDESATRRTLFVEPPVAIEPMNEIRELEIDEAREVHRILRALSDELRPLSEPLLNALDALCELDSIKARAHFAISHGGTAPALEDEGSGHYRVVEGRHPLLVATGEDVVPFDLELGERESVLLVSGPNAGGKTVLLKAIGLISILGQSGVIPPIGPGTRLPFFRSIFAVIGDEQSIEASLSTFSAQVRNLAMILRDADEASLVLIDEIGAATDPSEGGALAGAALQRLAPQARLTVVTTHLGSLKGLAAENDRIVNASLEFDSVVLEPTFHLVRDRPGRSYALEIAARLGLPPSLIEEARDRVGTEVRAVDDLLRDLENAQAELDVTRDSIESRNAELAEREAQWTRRWAELERREAEVEAAARDATERYLLDARRDVERAIARLEDRYAAAASGDDDATTAGAAREARDAVERAIRESRDGRPIPGHAPDSPPLRPGMWVRLRGTQRTGRVIELRGRRAIIEAKGLRLTAKNSDLEPVEPGVANAGESDASGHAAEERDSVRQPEIPVQMEIDLRGLRVDEIESALLPALDAAVVADLPWLRIIHGKGTGALRSRVREVLSSDRRVPGFRSGSTEEGGTGVTVVEFQGS
jgi:DNA mismatch repair protein MutS2